METKMAVRDLEVRDIRILTYVSQNPKSTVRDIYSGLKCTLEVPDITARLLRLSREGLLSRTNIVRRLEQGKMVDDPEVIKHSITQEGREALQARTAQLLAAGFREGE